MNTWIVLVISSIIIELFIVWRNYIMQMYCRSHKSTLIQHKKKIIMMQVFRFIYCDQISVECQLGGCRIPVDSELIFKRKKKTTNRWIFNYPRDFSGCLFILSFSVLSGCCLLPRNDNNNQIKKCLCWIGCY